MDAPDVPLSPENGIALANGYSRKLLTDDNFEVLSIKPYYDPRGNVNSIARVRIDRLPGLDPKIKKPCRYKERNVKFTRLPIADALYVMGVPFDKNGGLIFPDVDSKEKVLEHIAKFVNIDPTEISLQMVAGAVKRIKANANSLGFTGITDISEAEAGVAVAVNIVVQSEVSDTNVPIPLKIVCMDRDASEVELTDIMFSSTGGDIQGITSTETNGEFLIQFGAVPSERMIRIKGRFNGVMAESDLITIKPNVNHDLIDPLRINRVFIQNGWNGRGIGKPIPGEFSTMGIGYTYDEKDHPQRLVAGYINDLDHFVELHSRMITSSSVSLFEYTDAIRYMGDGYGIIEIVDENRERLYYNKFSLDNIRFDTLTGAGNHYGGIADEYEMSPGINWPPGVPLTIVSVECPTAEILGITYRNKKAYVRYIPEVSTKPYRQYMQVKTNLSESTLGWKTILPKP